MKITCFCFWEEMRFCDLKPYLFIKKSFISLLIMKTFTVFSSVFPVVQCYLPQCFSYLLLWRSLHSLSHPPYINIYKHRILSTCYFLQALLGAIWAQTSHSPFWGFTVFKTLLVYFPYVLKRSNKIFEEFTVKKRIRKCQKLFTEQIWIYK